MSGKARSVSLTETTHSILSNLSSRTTIANRLLVRAKIILLAFEKRSNSEIGSLVGIGRKQVGLWRRRWKESVDALLVIEFSESHASLVRSIEFVLSDAPRSGSHGKFTAEQITQIVATGCEAPHLSGRPIETWTGRELTDEVKQRGIVDFISVSHVGRILRGAILQPHRYKYWCFTTEKDEQVFNAQVRQVCETYLNASELYHCNNTRTVCVDEMTSLQANEHRAKTKYCRPGQVTKIECQYNRHGTLSLTGSWDVVLGQMIQSTINETRNSEDFANHIEQTIASDPSANWIFVVDNLNTHCGEAIVRTVAKLIGIEQETLGDKKRRRGILKSTLTRREFLSDQSHSVRFVFTPKHSSWLNQIEIIFGIIAKRVMRHGSFTSKANLKENLQSFIQYFNQNFAKPVDWTFTGTKTNQRKETRPRTWREKRQLKKAADFFALVG